VQQRLDDLVHEARTHPGELGLGAAAPDRGREVDVGRDVEGARLVNARMLESFAFETGDDAPNPIPTKAMMRHIGIDVGQARLPMGIAPDFVERRAPEVLANLQRWRDAFPERPEH